MIFDCDFLRAKMLFNRHRKIGSALNGRIVGDDHAFDARNLANARDDTSARRRYLRTSPTPRVSKAREMNFRDLATDRCVRVR